MKKGFTLIELLIVIAIIGILAVAFLPSMLGGPSKARDTQRIAVAQKIASVLTQNSMNGTLPDGVQCIGLASATMLSTNTTPAAATIKPADFGGKNPVDPSKGNSFPYPVCNGYLYIRGTNVPGTGYAFAVIAKMENKEAGNFVLPAATSFPATLATTGGYDLTPTATAWVTAQGAGPYYALLIQ